MADRLMAKLISKEEAKKKALVGGAAIGVGGTAAGFTSGTSAFPTLAKSRVSSSEAKKLIKEVAKRDVPIVSSKVPGAYATPAFSGLLRKIKNPIARKNLEEGFSQALVGRFGVPSSEVTRAKNIEAILVSKNKPYSSVIAHEAGHARLGDINSLGRIGALGVPAALLLSALGAKKEIETGKKSKGYRAAALGAGALGTASVVAPEATASILGYKGLKKLKLPRKGGKLGLSLAGASYLLPAAAIGLGAPAAIFAASSKRLKKEGSLAKAEQMFFSSVSRAKSKAKRKALAYIEKKLNQEFASMAKTLGVPEEKVLKSPIKVGESRWGKVAQEYEKTGAIPIKRLGKKLLRRAEPGIGKVVDIGRQEQRQQELAKRKQFSIKTPIGQVAPANVIA